MKKIIFILVIVIIIGAFAIITVRCFLSKDTRSEDTYKGLSGMISYDLESLIDLRLLVKNIPSDVTVKTEFDQEEFFSDSKERWPYLEEGIWTEVGHPWFYTVRNGSVYRKRADQIFLSWKVKKDLTLQLRL